MSPSKIWDKNQISKDTSNISPSDFDEWEKNSLKSFKMKYSKSNSSLLLSQNKLVKGVKFSNHKKLLVAQEQRSQV